mgnify:CR=1 FL=1
MYKNSIALITVVAILISIIGCASVVVHNNNNKRSSDNTNYSCKVYLEDQVYGLQTPAKLTGDKQLYVEILQKDGEIKKGNLVDISDDYLDLNTGFLSQTSEDTTAHSEQLVTIAKRDIFILRLW